MHLCKDDCNFREALRECGRDFDKLGRWILENPVELNLIFCDCEGNEYNFLVSKFALDPATVGRCAWEEFEDDFEEEEIEQ